MGSKSSQAPQKAQATNVVRLPSTVQPFVIGAGSRLPGLLAQSDPNALLARAFDLSQNAFADPLPGADVRAYGS